jgi:outer membrane lipopolysaccharide assembly protein LptE/RlpB
LSVDADTGKVREMEIGLQIEMSVRAADGSLVSAPEEVTWTQDFVFDEGSLLGTEEVETTIRYELAKDAARSLIFRLEALDLQPKPKNAG